MTQRISMLAAFFAVVLGMLGCAATRPAAGKHLAPYGPIEVYYEVHAPSRDTGKTPLVFVHGWACDHQYWASTLDAMAGDRLMLTLDLPGYGQSPDGGAEHTMDFYADGVIAAMDDAGIDRAVLLGHSMGTPVVRQVERNHPERIAGLVAVDGSLKPMAPLEASREFAKPLFTDEWQEFSVRMFDGMSGAMARDEDRALVRKVMLSTTQRSMQGGFTAMHTDDIWTDDRINTPVLAVMADAPMWTNEYKAAVRRMAPGVRFVVIGGVSHFLMMDDPEGFAKAVETWLEQRGL